MLASRESPQTVRAPFPGEDVALLADLGAVEDAVEEAHQSAEERVAESVALGGEVSLALVSPGAMPSAGPGGRGAASTEAPTSVSGDVGNVTDIAAEVAELAAEAAAVRAAPSHKATASNASRAKISPTPPLRISARCSASGRVPSSLSATSNSTFSSSSRLSLRVEAIV